MADESDDVRQLQYLNAVEAAAIWQTVLAQELSPKQYAALCESGEIERFGVAVRRGEANAWLTDIDSLLAGLRAKVTDLDMAERLDEMVEERRLELGE